MKKKFFKSSAVIALAMTFSLAGCSDNTNANVSVTSATSADTVINDVSENTEITEISSDVNISDAAGKDDLTFPIGQAINGGSFTGTAYIAPMIANDDTYNFPQTNNVTFEPGARSGWHTHGGMIILVTGGAGYYQEEGKPAQIIRKGDVIQCPEGVRHWHGALPDSWFSQMVIYDTSYSSFGSPEEPVTDEEYNSLEAAEYEGRTENAAGTMFPKAAAAMDSDTFSGAAYVSSLVDKDNAAGAPDMHYVVFDKGVINNWHTHEGGQILIATDGIGFHQIEGGDIEIMRPGDIAYCPPGVKHWHGGSSDTEFAHIAINTNPDMGGSVEWFERISDEEYRSAMELAEAEIAAGSADAVNQR